jgi:hypothetical protein
MSWAYGLNLLQIEDPDAATVESWEGDYPSDEQAHQAGRAAHGPDGDIIVAWVERLTYSNLLPSATQLLADMKERAAESGGDTTCFDNLTPADTARLDGELRAVMQVWEEELNEPDGEDGIIKRSQAVHVRNRKRFPPLPKAVQ